MKELLQGRDALIWDFDGVLYSYHFNDIPADKLNQNFFSANGKGAQELIPWLSDEEAFNLGKETFLRYHDTVTGFLSYAKDLEMSEKEFKSKLLVSQLKWSFKHISENIPELIAPCEETNILFEQLSTYVTHAMITHANAKYWAKPVSQNLGVEKYFDHIMGYDDFDFKSKRESAYAVSLALEKLGAKPENAIFIEDQPKHLEIAKEAYPDICNVLIEAEEPIEKPDYVDIMVHRPKNFMQTLLEVLSEEKEAA